jgi:hypothetical protein
MGVIVDHVPHTPGDVWKKARWAFKWLLGLAGEECRDHSEMRSVFEQASALDGLHLHLLPPEQARAARQILLGVAWNVARGVSAPVEVDGRVLDPDAQRQFRKAARELITLLRKKDGGDSE